MLEQVFTDVPADGSDDLALLLSACKFLDLLLTLQTQEFQMCVPSMSKDRALANGFSADNNGCS